MGSGPIASSAPAKPMVLILQGKDHRLKPHYVTHAKATGTSKMLRPGDPPKATPSSVETSGAVAKETYSIHVGKDRAEKEKITKFFKPQPNE